MNGWGGLIIARSLGIGLYCWYMYINLIRHDCGDFLVDWHPNFNLELEMESDDNSLSITQESRSNEYDVLPNNIGENVDLEGLFNSSCDSAFDGDSSFEKFMSTQQIIEESLKMDLKGSAVESVPKYNSEVEDISDCDDD